MKLLRLVVGGLGGGFIAFFFCVPLVPVQASELYPPLPIVATAPSPRFYPDGRPISSVVPVAVELPAPIITVVPEPTIELIKKAAAPQSIAKKEMTRVLGISQTEAMASTTPTTSANSIIQNFFTTIASTTASSTARAVDNFGDIFVGVIIGVALGLGYRRWRRRSRPTDASGPEQPKLPFDNQPPASGHQ